MPFIFIMSYSTPELFSIHIPIFIQPGWVATGHNFIMSLLIWGYLSSAMLQCHGDFILKACLKEPLIAIPFC